MLESRPEDAPVKLVKTVKIVETVETAKTAHTAHNVTASDTYNAA